VTQSFSELTSEQRLQQTEILLATAAEMINQLTYKQDRNTQAIEQITQQQNLNSKAISENIEGIKNLRLSLAQSIDLFNDSMKVIKQMQSEIRGMQTENQRMLRHLFGEDES
jgi:hypothetical protein